MNPKLEQVLQSRKVWATVLALATTASLYGMDEITAGQANDSLVWITGIFVGAVALEDGLAGLLKVWIISDSEPDTNPRPRPAPRGDPPDLGNVFFDPDEYERTFGPQ